MTIIRLTREFSFEMAHALEGYDGLCRHLHGHSYRLFVTIAGTPCADPGDPKYGMVMDFTDLKAIVNRLIVEPLDHSLVIRRTDTNGDFIETLRSHWGRVREVEYQPTCEKMIERFAQDISRELPATVKLVELRLYETEKSHATWLASDNE